MEKVGHLYQDITVTHGAAMPQWLLLAHSNSLQANLNPAWFPSAEKAEVSSATAKTTRSDYFVSSYLSVRYYREGPGGSGVQHAAPVHRTGEWSSRMRLWIWSARYRVDAIAVVVELVREALSFGKCRVV